MYLRAQLHDPLRQYSPGWALARQWAGYEQEAVASHDPTLTEVSANGDVASAPTSSGGTTFVRCV